MDARLLMPKRIVSAAAAFFVVLLLGGCRVRLDIADAVAEPLSAAEVQKLDETTSGPGTWYHVSVFLPRASIRRIARWELYTDVAIEDCRTGALAGIVTPAGMGDAHPSGYFEQFQDALDAHPRQSLFDIGGDAFIDVQAAPNGQCVRLDGGSYMLQKIISKRVQLRFAQSDDAASPGAQAH